MDSGDSRTAEAMVLRLSHGPIFGICRSGNYAEARTLLQQALELNPAHPPALVEQERALLTDALALLDEVCPEVGGEWGLR